MLALLFTNLLSLEYLRENPWTLLVFGFQIWMLVDAVRQREWVWALFIVVGWGFAALWYYFYVYRAAPSATRVAQAQQ